jgi:hypothetical protein
MAEKKSLGLNSRVVTSIALVAGWLLFLMIFLAFYVPGFGTQNLAIVLAPLLVVIAILGTMWANLGIKYMWREATPVGNIQGAKYTWAGASPLAGKARARK